MRDVYVDSVVFDQPNIGYFVDRLGADHVLFGTDSPMLGCDSLRAEVLDGGGPGERRLIESENLDRLSA